MSITSEDRAWILAVAAEMPGWYAQSDEYGAVLVGAGCQRIYVNTWRDRNTGKASVSWWLASELTQHAPRDTETRKEINVSLNKVPAVAARDITRRLLPELATVEATCTEHAVASARRANDRIRAIHAFANVYGGQIRNSGKNGGYEREYTPVVDVFSYHHGNVLKPYGTGEFTVTLTLTGEEMARVLSVVRDIRTERSK